MLDARDACGTKIGTFVRELGMFHTVRNRLCTMCTLDRNGKPAWPSRWAKTDLVFSIAFIEYSNYSSHSVPRVHSTDG